MLLGASQKQLPTIISDEFLGVNRYWDNTNGMPASKILPGEYFVSREDELITTVLGSCISVCVRDPVARVGGMNHFMLPKVGGYSGDHETRLLSEAGRYGNVAMERLINCILKNGGSRFNLEFKIFGGARVLDIDIDVGNRNIMFITEYLQRENFLVEAHDLGGPYPRKINYFPRTGQVLVKKIKRLKGSTLKLREQAYSRALDKHSVEGEVTIFT
jgi:chemotaxis protein CheD